MSKAKPRVRFCWVCSALLGNESYVEAEVEGHMRIMHADCGETELLDNGYGVSARPRSSSLTEDE